MLAGTDTLAAVTTSSAVSSSAGRSGAIDYRLRREALLGDLKSGRRARHEVCDAHPDLQRAAANGVGKVTSMECPVCADDQLMHVTYVFGPRLPASGRCISGGAEELAALARRRGDFTCFVVEVCPSCSWHHLVRSHPLLRSA